MRFFVPSIVALFLLVQPVSAYKIYYAEQWYKLFHQHIDRMPEDELENIICLEEALKAPFAHPLYALARIEHKLDWEYYRYLFKLHVNLQMVRTYRQIASKYDRQAVYFFNAPFKQQNLESLAIAEKYYKCALCYWEQAHEWVQKANDARFKWINLEEIAFWQDELRQINEHELDFKKILERDLQKLAQNRKLFEAMDETTY